MFEVSVAKKIPEVVAKKIPGTQGRLVKNLPSFAPKFPPESVTVSKIVGDRAPEPPAFPGTIEGAFSTFLVFPYFVTPRPPNMVPEVTRCANPQT